MNPSTPVERRTLLEAICADPELTGNALKLAMTLMAFVNNETGRCCPAQRTISNRCHMSRNTIDVQARALEDRGWVRMERDGGGDRESNRYHFAFDRVRKGGDHYGFGLRQGREELPLAETREDGNVEFHGSTFEPCSDVHGSVSQPSMAQNAEFHGSKVEPELTEQNSQNGTQESLFGEEPFDFESWFEQQWWPQCPLKVEKAAAKKLAGTIIEGRRGDGLKPTPDELLAGIMRYAAAVVGIEPRYIKHPTTWLNKGCWTDEHAEPGGFGSRASDSTNAVWSAIDEMPARNRRAG
jgi:helix-turn-helix protein